MSPTDAIRTGLAKSLKFKGRASRSEFWWLTTLIVLPIVMVATMMLLGPNSDLINYPWIVLTLFPFAGLSILLAAGMRRFRDTGIPTTLWPCLMLFGAWSPIVGFLVGTDIAYLPTFFFFLTLFGGPLLVLFGCGLAAIPSAPNPNEVPS